MMNDGDGRDKDIWYKNGLKFQCTQCGECCSGQAGSVHFSESEGEAIARKLKISVANFHQQYCRKTVFGQWELKELEVDRSKWTI